MKLYKSLCALGVAVALAAGLSGCGEEKAQKQSAQVPTFGICQLVEHAALDAANRGIVDAIKDRGIKANWDQQNAQADQSNLANISQRFVTQKYPLLFAIATPAAQTLANATSTTPIVATAVTDFAVAKLVKSNEAPGTNVTGSSDMNPIAAQLDLLLALAPQAKVIGTIYNSSEINSQFQIDILKKCMQGKGVALKEVTISSVNDVQQAAQSLVGKIDAMYLPTDNVVASSMPILAQVINQAKIPVVTGEEGMMKAGGLATVGVDYYQLGRIAGEMGADIYQGKSQPATMPIRFQTKFKAKINETVAKQIGISIPKAVADSSEFVK